MSAISEEAANKMQRWIQQNGFGDDQALLEYAFALSSYYGEAIGALACDMYEKIAEAQGVTIPQAEIADTPEFGEVAKAIHGTMKESLNKVDATVGRLVKQTGADTMLKNAKRDGAYFAWVPSGDSCPYCKVLGAIGWQKAGKKTIKGDHADHIHPNCDCQYMIDFKGDMLISGYGPDSQKDEIRKAINQELGDDKDFDTLLRTLGPGEMARLYKKNTYKMMQSMTRVKNNDTMSISAITKYKGGDALRINALLRETDDINKLEEADQKFIADLDRELRNIKQYKGTLTRVVDFSGWLDEEERLSEFLEMHEIGGIVQYKQYLSTSKSLGHNDDSKVRIFIDSSTKGRDISAIGLSESEVLYERNSTFRVINKTYEKGFWYILLEEE
ncbi:MAG: hypothetical protein MJ116_02860 [Lachnospiraceae bacterium]|nr:hypothetical protein [Lachnospiraceae bacterium]